MKRRIIQLLLYVVTIIFVITFSVMASSESERQLTNYYGLLQNGMFFCCIVFLSLEIVSGIFLKEKPPTRFVFFHAYIPIIAGSIITWVFISHTSEYVLLRYYLYNIINLLLTLFIVNTIAKLVYRIRRRELEAHSLLKY